jgi:hypothetical protein
VPPAGSSREDLAVLDPEALRLAENDLRSRLASDYPSDDEILLEEVADVLGELQKGGAQIVYPCRTHDQHKGTVPLMEVVSTSCFFLIARLECGHKFLYQGAAPELGTMLPCIMCMEDCHS